MSPLPWRPLTPGRALAWAHELSRPPVTRGELHPGGVTLAGQDGRLSEMTAARAAKARRAPGAAHEDQGDAGQCTRAGGARTPAAHSRARVRQAPVPGLAGLPTDTPQTMPATAWPASGPQAEARR
jgi:hypothetical protein